MNPVSILSIDELRRMKVVRTVGRRFCLARPSGQTGLRWRLHCAWMAFTGQCDLVAWREDCMAKAQAREPIVETVGTTNSEVV